MGVFRTLSISGSGLTAERLRMDLIADNLANVNTTRTEDGGAFRRKMAVFEPRRVSGAKPGQQATQGVRVQQIVTQPGPGKMVYDPDHPHANAEGYVEYPNINVVSEMVDMISATRAYEANVTAINAAKAMATKALEIGRG